MMAQIAPRAIMVPKAERIEDLARVHVLASVIALVETAEGLAEARAMARSGLVARFAFGSIDYAADLGCDHAPDLKTPTVQIVALRRRAI